LYNNLFITLSRLQQTFLVVVWIQITKYYL